MQRFGLVLGGGGYAGTAFHAGVLTALARAGWDARDAAVVVGTSAGATAAALTGAGFPPDEYVALVGGQPISAEAAAVMEGMTRLRTAPPLPRPRLRPANPALAARALQRCGSLPIGVLLAALTPEGTVDLDSVSPGYGPRLSAWPQRPTWITAVDLTSGRRAVFGRTDTATLPQALAASVAIPGYFAPAIIDGVRYIDGGVWSMNNADLLLGTDIDVVIVSAPTSTPDPAALDSPNLLRLLTRRGLAREVASLRGDGKTVVVLHPDRTVRRVIGLNSMSLSRRGPVALASLAYASRAIAADPVLRRPVGA